MKRTLALVVTLLTCCPSVESTSSGGAGRASTSTPATCDSAEDCDPALDPCYVGACAVFHRCILKPSCLP